MNILFTHSYFLRFDPKQWKLSQPYAPLGTLISAAYLKKNGNKVSVFDTMFSHSPEEISICIEELKPDILVIYDDGFNYLTKMCLTNMREAALRMIEIAKQKGCTVIVSSSDSTDHYDLFLAKGADYVILGEAEQTLLELTQHIEKGKTIEDISGIVYKKENEIIKKTKREALKNLDLLPLPAWDLINIQQYKNAWERHGYFSMNMSTTRGCPYKCNWCAKPIYGNRYNTRSPQNVVEEIKHLKQIFLVDHIWFCDDIFGLKPGWLTEFADLLEKEKIKIRYKIQCRADLLLKEENIKALARSGCDNVWIGAESGSQKILDAMDKGTTIEQIYESTLLLKKHEIKPSFFIQFGYPGETMVDIQKTIKMIKDLLPFEIGISVSYPLPGTKFFETVKDQLKTKSNWTDSDEMALMFRNTFRPEFYKRLHKYVQRNYRMQLAFTNGKEILEGIKQISFNSIKKICSLLYFLPITYLDKFRLRILSSK